MTAPKALLFCDEELGGKLAIDTICQSDPYQALQTLKDDQCDLLITTTLVDDLESFCKAARRVNPCLKICVISSVADEPDLIKLTPDPIDSYFIYPPTGTQLASLCS